MIGAFEAALSVLHVPQSEQQRTPNRMLSERCADRDLRQSDAVGEPNSRPVQSNLPVVTGGDRLYSRLCSHCVLTRTCNDEQDVQVHQRRCGDTPAQIARVEAGWTATTWATAVEVEPVRRQPLVDGARGRAGSPAVYSEYDGDDYHQGLG